jgi:RNA polymerase sigma-70 factor (ECF subfamily)
MIFFVRKLFLNSFKKKFVRPLSQHTDQELLALLNSGDGAAFTEIYDRFSGLLYVYAFKLCGDEDNARDMLQDIFVSLWDRREQLVLRGALAGYLYSAVRFRFLKDVEKSKVRHQYSRAFLAEFGEELTADDYIGEKELIALIEQYVKDLPPQMQRVFTLSRLQHRTNPEIAEELGISEKTVRNLVSESLKTLKPKIGLGVLLILLSHL